jgi:hypothetical protein
MQVAEEGVPAGEGEPRHRGGHADVDAIMPALVLLVARGVPLA